MRKRLSTSAVRRAAAVVLCLAAVSACSPIVDARGNLPPAERLASITPGQSDRDHVLRNLGTPSTLSTFDDSTWYYVSYRTETVAFFAPKEVDRKVVAVDFDERGYVSRLRNLGLEDGQAVSYSKRETPTAGKEMTILQQLLGNLGRFSGEGGGGGPIGSPVPH